ncbi:carbohydrate ABC transporter permease [Streptomyces pseudovenezuelae]|uniref:carbohydrate ABC transporter permease n=1 Tax=Streptomyces pseudovenezuelae TaxID=67350 RepID=UPI002E8231A3|nr:carbohydrate ABC transporter permease [Streptomyces pseudovenezuelae]WUA87320.1 carbohydrate ABC transporter permease [Streptomyces pseudovenezuelae]
MPATASAAPATPPPAAPAPVRRSRKKPLVFTVLLVISVLMALPFVELLISSLRPAAETSSDTWLPSVLDWHNYADAVRTIPFWRFGRNSLILSVVNALLTTLSSALVGYGFARLRAPGKSLLFGLLISTMMVPQIVTLIPTYLLFAQLGMVGTYWPWVLWGSAGAPYAIFLYRQFFSSFPKELEEAAVIDGAGRIRVFFQIFLPLSRPLMVTAFVLAFNAVWGDFIAPNLLLDQSNTTLAVGVGQGYVNDKGFPVPNLLAGGAVLYLVPVILLFLAAQRSYVRGFVNSGLK